MATVNNASGVYSTLGYNFNDPNGYVQIYSPTTQKHLNSMPAFIAPWQAQDAASGRATNNANYFQNPTTNVINTISTTAANISSFITVNGITSLSNVANIANSLITTTSNFLSHTNRISGVTVYAGDTTVPYYTTAMSYGKQAMYIVNQTDGIINTSPMLGSFTSLLVTPQINANSNVITSEANTILNNYASLTTPQINQIYNDWSNTNTFLTNQQNADVGYFNNLQTFINNYNTTRQFSNLGETQNYLITNFIGTPTLVYNLQNNNNNASYYTNTIVASNSSGVTNGAASSGGGAGIVPTGVTAGTYVAPSLNIDIYGRITSASNVSSLNLSSITSSSTTFSGYSLAPTMPFVSFYPSGITSGVVGSADGSVYLQLTTANYLTLVDQVGNNWNGSQFTCPVAGMYQVSISGIKYPQGGVLHIDLRVNNVAYAGGNARTRAEETATYCQFGSTYILRCSAGDAISWWAFGGAGWHPNHGIWSIRLVG